MLFLREIKALEARQRLEALVIPKRQALTRLQGLLAPLLHITEMAFLKQLKTSIFRLFGYRPCRRIQPLFAKHCIVTKFYWLDVIQNICEKVECD
jgi:hypothetical protein